MEYEPGRFLANVRRRRAKRVNQQRRVAVVEIHSGVGVPQHAVPGPFRRDRHPGSAERVGTIRMLPGGDGDEVSDCTFVTRVGGKPTEPGGELLGLDAREPFGQCNYGGTAEASRLGLDERQVACSRQMKNVANELRAGSRVRLAREGANQRGAKTATGR